MFSSFRGGRNVLEVYEIFAGLFKNPPTKLDSKSRSMVLIICPQFIHHPICVIDLASPTPFHLFALLLVSPCCFTNTFDQSNASHRRKGPLALWRASCHPWPLFRQQRSVAPAQSGCHRLFGSSWVCTRDAYREVSAHFFLNLH